MGPDLKKKTALLFLGHILEIPLRFINVCCRMSDCAEFTADVPLFGQEVKHQGRFQHCVDCVENVSVLTIFGRKDDVKPVKKESIIMHYGAIH